MPKTHVAHLADTTRTMCGVTRDPDHCEPWSPNESDYMFFALCKNCQRAYRAERLRSEAANARCQGPDDAEYAGQPSPSEQAQP